MLGAVIFGQKHFQPVIDAIIKLAETRRQGAVGLRAGRRRVAARRRCAASPRTSCARPIPIPPSRSAATGRRRQGEGRSPRCVQPTTKARRRARCCCSAFKEAREGRRALRTSSKTGMRIDGRDPKTVRPIVCEVGILPRTHGSALFTRGETQALVVATLGTGEDEQYVDAWKAPTKSASCCTTTSRPTRSARRAAWARPAGARSATASSPGALSIRCCRSASSSPTPSASSRRSPSSNGSSSMATVCGSSLAMMDAGIPLKRRSPASPWA